MSLTDTAIRSAKPEKKPIKLFDGGGLYLEIAPAGGKWWRLKYRFGGKEKRISLGVYPTIGLKEARDRREEAKKLLAQGIDPSEQKKEAKAAAVAAERELTTVFEAIAREWYAKKTTDLTPGYRKQILARLESQVFPHIGNIPITDLEPASILEAARQAEARGRIETAHRLTQLIGQVCRYARICGYCKYDVASGLTEALQKVEVRHHATITDPAAIGSLLREIEGYSGDPSVKNALRLLPYVFLRSKEIRGAQWDEFNFDEGIWIVPAGRMKKVRGSRTPHIVPLARQVIDLLLEFRETAYSSTLVFPSPFSATRCISDMGLLNALRRMGYGKDDLSIHGFRAMASTLLNEKGYRAEVVEAQLFHHERNSVRAAYNHAEYLPERKQMMQEWADLLDQLRIVTWSNP